jgi:ABC-2 type transport system permease protein
MNKIWTIARRELNVFFDSLTAYILLVVFWHLQEHLPGCLWPMCSLNQASMQSFFSVAYWTFFVLIPALTMRLIAEEKKSGTLELLLTKPVSDWQLYWVCLLQRLCW